MKIEITQADIDNATEQYCPIAQALRRYGFDVGAVGYTGIYLRNGDVFPLPPDATKFMSTFDDAVMGMDVVPITLELPLIKHTFFSRLLAKLLRRF